MVPIIVVCGLCLCGVRRAVVEGAARMCAMQRRSFAPPSAHYNNKTPLVRHTTLRGIAYWLRRGWSDNADARVIAVLWSP